MVSTNLPLQLTSFVDRERELAEVKRLLSTTRLLTLTGAGGCGKTRLAVQVASHLLPTLPDGVWFADLAPISDAALVPQAIASAFDLHEFADSPLLVVLTNYLRAKHLLLLLDNCEHLIAACAQASDTLLRTCANLHILATSRQVLGIDGETSFRVPSLSLPDLRPMPPLDALARFESIQLFLARAAAVKPGFQLTPSNAPRVAQICHRLDGMPLAIELAAARVRSLSVEQIASRLDDGFQLLTGGSRTALPRQQTLLAAMDWSYALLSEQEKILLRSLSVFAGGWTLEAAEAVCSVDGIDAQSILDLELQLVDKSLVNVDERDGTMRYRMLETIRQYAGKKLIELDEAPKVRDRHLNFFIKLAENSEFSLLGGAEHLRWLQRWELEHDNLRTALAWSLENNEIEAGLRLSGTVRWFWLTHGYLEEGRECLHRLLRRSDETSTLSRAKALETVCWIEAFVDDVEAALPAGEESLALYRELNYKLGIAWSLVVLGNVVRSSGDRLRARSLYEESLALGREIGDRLVVVWVLIFLGDIAFVDTDYPKARPLYDESLALGRLIGDKWSRAVALLSLGRISLEQANSEEAATFFMSSLELCRELRENLNLCASLLGLGDVALFQGDYRRAKEFYAESLTLSSKYGDIVDERDSLAGIGALAWATGLPEQAVRLYGAARALSAPFGDGMRIRRRVEDERNIDDLRSQLGEPGFAKAWEEGSAMPLERAIAEAEQIAIAQPASTVPAAYPAGLTDREVEVLRLLALGVSNQEIADRLVLSKRTVEAHLRSIFGKLHVTTRSGATRAAIENKIV